MKVVMISDTHGQHRKLDIPDGDILIHAGDIMTNGRNPKEVSDFNDWLGTLPHPNKVIIAGNHDFLFEKKGRAKDLITNATYLQDESTHIEGLNIYGSPWQPEFFNWAFNLPRGRLLAEKWNLIPDDTDILVTHGPPLGFQDLVPRFCGGEGMSFESVGCADLYLRVKEVKPLIHVFGHIHCGAGYSQDDYTTYVNAAVVDEVYRICHKPTVITLKKNSSRKWTK